MLSYEWTHRFHYNITVVLFILFKVEVVTRRLSVQSVTQGCVMTLTQGQVAKVNITVRT